MNPPPAAPNRTLLLTMCVAGALQGTVLLSLLLMGHFDGVVRDLAIMYCLLDATTALLGKRSGMFGRAWFRLSVYCSCVVVLVVYALVVNVMRRGLHP